jgi:hypothetical protein
LQPRHSSKRSEIVPAKANIQQDYLRLLLVDLMA